MMLLLWWTAMVPVSSTNSEPDDCSPAELQSSATSKAIDYIITTRLRNKDKFNINGKSQMGNGAKAKVTARPTT